MKPHCVRCGTERPRMTACPNCGLEWSLTEDRISRAIDEMDRIASKSRRGVADYTRLSELASEVSACVDFLRTAVPS